jgi:hypothetical protein
MESLNILERLFISSLGSLDRTWSTSACFGGTSNEELNIRPCTFLIESVTEPSHVDVERDRARAEVISKISDVDQEVLDQWNYWDQLGLVGGRCLSGAGNTISALLIQACEIARDRFIIPHIIG